METWRTVLLIATILGFVTTAYGLVAAYLAAKGERENASDRIEMMKRLAAEEQADEDAQKANPVETVEEREKKHEARYEAEGLVRPTYGNMVYLAAFESERLLGRVLAETKRDFVIAGVGLVISTVASAGSLYLDCP